MRRFVPWAIVLTVALAYPLAVVAGGTPSFPSRDECAHPAIEDGDIDAVFGYFDSERTRRCGGPRAGFRFHRNRAGVERLWPSSRRGRRIPTLEVGREFTAEANSVGFEVTLEQAGSSSNVTIARHGRSFC